VRSNKMTEDNCDLMALTRLMQLSSEVSALAIKLYDTEEAALGMKAMEIADQISEEAGRGAERAGYTMDEVTRPLWNQN
jgi:hypothetical protein